MARRHPIMKCLRLKIVRDFCFGFVFAGAVLVILFLEMLQLQPAKTLQPATDQSPVPVQKAPAQKASVKAVTSGGGLPMTGNTAPNALVKPAPQGVQDAPRAAAPAVQRGNSQSSPGKRWAGASSIDSRVYFTDMLGELGFSGTQGIEVGAAKGRFSDFLLHRWLPKHWILIDPVLLPQLKENLNNWKKDPLLQSAKIEFLQGYSTEEKVLSKIAERSFDFIYIDAAHDYENVKKELPHFWKRLRTGGLMAGHDYCGTKDSVAKLPKALVKGRPHIRSCGPYTDFAAKNPTSSGKIRKEGGEAKDQIGVVRAVLEWLQAHPELELHATTENFTRESLARDNINYDDIITSTRNPSWYLFKP